MSEYSVTRLGEEWSTHFSTRKKAIRFAVQWILIHLAESKLDTTETQGRARMIVQAVLEKEYETALDIWNGFNDAYLKLDKSQTDWAVPKTIKIPDALYVLLPEPPRKYRRDGSNAGKGSTVCARCGTGDTHLTSGTPYQCSICGRYFRVP